MIHKKVFSSDQRLLNDVSINKILNKDIFGKAYIRGSLIDSQIVAILDNNNSFSNISVQNINKMYGNNFGKQIEGTSIQTNLFFYKNKLNNGLKFSSYILNSVRYRDLLDSFYISLGTLRVSKKKKRMSLVILQPIKGGFNCYSSGVSGFLPRSHGIFFLIKTVMSVIKDKRKKRRLFNLNSLIQNQNLKKKIFPLRLEFFFGHILIYSGFRRKNFSVVPIKRRRRFINESNFVFLSKKVKKQNI